MCQKGICKGRDHFQTKQDIFEAPLLLTDFTEEMNGVRKLRLLQLQLTLLDELEELVAPEDGELWRDSGPLQKNSTLQLHIAVWYQLAHDKLALDL